MRPNFFLTVMAVLYPAFAFAQSSENCGEIADDLARLACYDKSAAVAEKPSETEAETSEATDSPKVLWKYKEQKDDFDGSTTSYITLDSDAPYNSARDLPALLVVKCDGKGKTDVYVIATGYIGSRNNVPVRYRFDGSDAVSERWNGSTDGKAAFLPPNYRDFRTGLRSGKEFFFELTNFQGSTGSAKFPATEEDPDVAFVFAGCKK